MLLKTGIPFFLAIAAYVAAALTALQYLRGAEIRVLLLGRRLAIVGSVLLLLVFVLRWMEWHLVPMTGLGDSLNLFILFCSATMLIVQRNERMRPLLCFYLPALAVLALVSGAVGLQYLGEAPRELNGVLLAIHVGLAFLAFALFFVASLTSMAYVFQAQHLKRRKTTGLFQKLPSLERLDKVLFRLISVGYPLFAVTMIFGLYWAWADRDLLGKYWFLSPKIFLSVVMAAFYSLSFHVRRFGLLRGPKLAYLVFCGFTLLLVTYLALGVMRVGKYNFWDSAL